jgi:hypothetical protein
MTHEEMQSIAMDYLRKEHPELVKFLTPEELKGEARAMAMLARMEMDTLKAGSPRMTDDEAWSEAREMFLVRPEWAYEKMADAKAEAREERRRRLEANPEPARLPEETAESPEL